MYDKLLCKIGMGKLRAADESLFEAVEGDKFIGVEDDFLSFRTACSERM